MKRALIVGTAAALIALILVTPRKGADSAAAASVTRLVRLDGLAQKVGNGTARTFIVVDEQNPDVPVEVGVALSEGAMEGLPKPMAMNHAASAGGEHLDMHNWLLDLPSKNPTPYKFVQFGWNPKGHEPPGVWDVPHFDFHFYTVPVSVRNSILPSDPQFAEKAARYPADSLRPPFYLDAAAAAKTTPAAMTVPEMGLHWIDVRTPEVQAIAGKPEAYKPFTKTYIYGTWNGEFIFGEPMITRAYLLEKRATKEAAVRDELIPVPSAVFTEPGYYPEAYRIRWDEKSREYLVSVTRFAKQ